MFLLRCFLCVFVIPVYSIQAQTTFVPPITLNTDVTVTSKNILLSDLFSGLDGAYKSRATQVVAQAPLPGKMVTYNYTWLKAMANQYQLPWEPANKFDQVVVKRASQMIPLDPIQIEILRLIQKDYPNQEFKISLDNPALSIHVGTEEPAGVQIESVTYDTRSDKFQAQLILDAEPQKPIKISGHVHPVTQVPVLNRVVGESEIIQPQDISLIPFPNRSLPKGVVLGVDQIHGMQPKRILRVNHPINAQDLKKPQTIKKGSLVTIRLKRKNMLLTVKGKALEHGSMGDVIQVENASSQKVLTGLVTGPDTIDVGE